MKEEEIIKEQLVCEGYCFLNNDSILCLTGKELNPIPIKEADPSNVFIFWEDDLIDLLNWCINNGIKISNSNYSGVIFKSFSPCPVKLFSNDLTGQKRLEI